MNPPAALLAAPRSRRPAPRSLLAATALATLLAQAAPAQPAATDAPPLPTPGAPATLLPPDDLASPDAAPGLEAQPELQANVTIAAFFLLYDMNGKYGAEYTFNSSPQLADTVVRAYRGSTGALLGTAISWRENYGAMLNATVGDGYYVEFSSSQSPTVAGYWAAGMPVPGTSNFPIWLVPVDGEAVGMKFGGGDWSHVYPNNSAFAAVEVRPMIAQQGPGATLGQRSGAFLESGPTMDYRIEYLVGNQSFGRGSDSFTTTFNDNSMSFSWGDDTFGINLGDAVPYGPIRITCSVEGMISGSIDLEMLPKHVWIARPVLFENPSSSSDGLFMLPVGTPLPIQPFPTAPDALRTGAMNQVVSSVDQWRVLER